MHTHGPCGDLRTELDVGTGGGRSAYVQRTLRALCTHVCAHGPRSPRHPLEIL